MIPAGYIAKKNVAKPDLWVSLKHVSEIYSVSGCISPAFPAVDQLEMLNGFWFTDSPDLIKQTDQENAIELISFQMFYYEFYEFKIRRDQEILGTVQAIPIHDDKCHHAGCEKAGSF